MMQQVGTGKRHIVYQDDQAGPDLGCGPERAVPAESSWRLCSLGPWHTNQIGSLSRQQARLEILEHSGYSEGLHATSPPKAIVLAWNGPSQSILAWNGPSQRNALTVKRLDWGLECETRPSLSSVAITATAFGRRFQDLRGSLSRKQVALSPSLLKNLGPPNPVWLSG